MEKNTKYILDNVLSDHAKEALNAALKSIYFNDSSDYLSGLWEVVEHLLESNLPEDADDAFVRDLVEYLNPHWLES